jgi:hypothetical protein
VLAGAGLNMASRRLSAAWRRSGLAAAAALASCIVLVVAVNSLRSARAPVELLETGMEYSQQPAQDFAAPPSQRPYVYSQQPIYYAGGQQLAAEGVLSAEAPLASPAEAPNYNGGEGMTYMPSTQSGVSDEDQSPTLSKEFLDDEARSQRRMKKLAGLLKKSAKEQDALDVRVKKLSEYVEGEVTSIRNDVLELNTKDTDEIAAPYHLVQGAR